jgi:hypothetical protein
MENEISKTEQPCTIHSVVRSLRYETESNGGWLFDSNLIRKIAQRARSEYDTDVTMEHVEAVLLAISDLQ